MIGSKEIGGGFVRRSFTNNGAFLKKGDELTPAQIDAMHNRRALISNEMIAVYPPGGAAAIGERHIVHNGGGRFDVIAGQRLNDRPLSKDEAEELATRPAN
jgi:hypothetical protein